MTTFTRTIAFSALLGATMLISPPASMAADSTTPAAPQPAQATMPTNQAAAPTPEATRETVEQRIVSLHASLKITPDEENNWGGVTKVMRKNAAEMDKLVAAKASKDAGSLTAVDDLKSYETFAQAHAHGLKILTSSFETLYKAMPDAQKKIADQVFASFGHHAGSSHS